MNVAILTNIIKETNSNWRFIFESPLFDSINFVPGQLVQLCAKPGMEDSIVRNYSVASWPDGTNKFELIITYLEGGAMSDYLFKEAKLGDEFIYRGPMGVFTLPETIDRDIFFVSTGSGISPFRSMVNWIAENGIETQNIKLFFGTRTQDDICYRGEMELIEQINPKFEFVPVLSREDEYWKGKKGYVHKHYLDLIDNMTEKPLVYFCGWNRMIEEGRKHLAERGFEMTKDIRVEIFG
jgi:CDP-4-dehydro-6-deoxyglucose reductase